jgi:hypothetical protein
MTSAINWNNENSRISKYFSVMEVTNGDRRRIPERGSSSEKNILALAYSLDLVRADWGRPILVTSWYRPSAINRAVGGAKGSQHLTGRAADIRPVTPAELAVFQAWLDEHWYGAWGMAPMRDSFISICAMGHDGSRAGQKGHAGITRGIYYRNSLLK